MKKLLLSLSLMFTALTLTNCSNELNDTIAQAPVGNFSFDVNVDSRATLTGYKTAWEANDALSLIYIDATDAESTSAAGNKAVYNATSQKFNADITLDAAKTYNFFAYYPYPTSTTANSGMYTAASTDKPYQTRAYLNVGNKSITQTGETNAHVPALAPMYYAGTAAESGENLSIQLHHAATLLDFTVVNKEAAAITLASLTVTAPTDTKICGTYYVNLSTGELTASGANYVSNASLVNIAEGTSIATDGTFHVYVPLAPFTLAAGDKLTISMITTDGATCVIEKTFASAMTFEAGKQNTATLNFVKAAVHDTPLTVTQVRQMIADGTTSFAGYTLQATVAAISTNNAHNMSYGTVIVTDNNGEKNSSIKIYNTNKTDGFVLCAENNKILVGDEITVSLNNAAKGEYNGSLQLTSVKNSDLGEVVSTDNTIAAKTITIADYNTDYADYDGVYLKFENVEPSTAGVSAAAASTFTDGTNSLAIYNRTEWQYGTGEKLAKIKGTLYAFGAVNNTTAQVTCYFKNDMADFYDPYVLDDNSVSFAAADDSTKAKTITATIKSGYAASVEVTGEFTASISADYQTITIAPKAANTATTELTGTVTVTVTKDAATVETKTIAVKQSAFGAATEYKVEAVYTSMKFTANQEPYTSTVLDDNITATYDKASGGNAPRWWADTKNLRLYVNNTMTITGTNGAKITKIIINFTSGKAYPITADAGDYSLDGLVGTWTGSATSVLFTVGSVSKQNPQIDSIEVTYTK